MVADMARMKFFGERMPSRLDAFCHWAVAGKSGPRCEGLHLSVIRAYCATVMRQAAVAVMRPDP